MARHRNVRGMDLDDEYFEDEVYGRSYEEDVAFSPSTAGFLYRRGQDTSQATLGSFLSSNEENSSPGAAQAAATAAPASDYLDQPIITEPEAPDISGLSLDDRTRLHSAMDHIRGVLGEDFSEPTAQHLLIGNKFDGECVLDMLLSGNCHVLPPPVVTATVAASPSVNLSTTSMSSSSNLPTRGLSTASPQYASPAGGSTASSKTASRNTSPYASQVDMRSASPHVAAPSSHDDSSTPSRRNKQTIDIAAEYAKRNAGRELINMVVVGHVDAGKSTLMGHLLVQLGHVGKRVMHKYESESRKAGKGSFAFAWVLDETGEERSRGITMDVGVTQFETEAKLVTLLDAPGHRDFIPNTITGAAQADVALLVIDASPGGFESGFEAGGQTREHSLLIRSLGVQQLAVVINKLDMVEWSQARFDEIVGKVKVFLRQAGFKEADLSYIPCSGLQGENLGKKSAAAQLTSWYSGPCLLDTINAFKIAERAILKPFRMFISDVFKGMGAGFSVCGKIESGSIQVADRLNIMPASEAGACKSISLHEEPVQWACAGDYATITLTGADMNNISVGMALSSPAHPIPTISRFRARIRVFNVEVPVTIGYPVLLHYQTVSEPAVVHRLISLLDKSGTVTKNKPRCLPKGSNAIVEIRTSRPVCLELYKDFTELGRFMLRSGSSTVATGAVTEIF